MAKKQCIRWDLSTRGVLKLSVADNNKPTLITCWISGYAANWPNTRVYQIIMHVGFYSVRFKINKNEINNITAVTAVINTFTTWMNSVNNSNMEKILQTMPDP